MNFVFTKLLVINALVLHIHPHSPDCANKSRKIIFSAQKNDIMCLCGHKQR